MFRKEIDEIKDWITENRRHINDDIISLCINIDSAKSDISTLNKNINTLSPTDKDIKNLNIKIDSQRKIIQSQQKTINTLVEALCGKFEKGLFVYSDDGRVPFVIRNGKVLTDQLTTSFEISWTFDSCSPNIEIQQDGITNEDMPTDDELEYFARRKDEDS